MSWSNDVVLEFLELYRVEQHLWDPKHPQHRNRSEISDAWLRIQNALSINCSVNDLKRKKESLMTAYRMHCNKKRVQESYRTIWFAFPLMSSFLGGKYECDSSTNEMESGYNDQMSVYTNLPIISQEYPQKSLERNQLCRLKSDSIKTNDDHSELTYAKKQMDEAISCLKRAVDDKKETDEYDLYGQLLAKKLRKLDERQRDVAMHEIDNIMFRAKMQSGPSRSYPSSPVPRKVNSPAFVSIGEASQTTYDHSTLQYDDHSDIHPAT